MTISPTLDLHPENHFEFAENTDSQGCCCFWKSISKPKEYFVNEKNELTPKKCNYRERIIANQRLSEIIKGEFKLDPISANDAFELIQMRVNMSNGDPLTSDKLIKIINEIHAIKTLQHKIIKRYTPTSERSASTDSSP